MAERFNFDLFQGEKKTVQFVHAGGGESLDGKTLRFRCRSESYTNSDELEKTTSDGITVTDADAGDFELTLTSGDTDGLAKGEYVYDVMDVTAGSEAVLVYGTFTVFYSTFVAVA